MNGNESRQHGCDVPTRWRRCGLILPRQKTGIGSEVVGDPCVVWDDRINNWRMLLFCLPGGVGQAVCTGDPTRADGWRVEGGLAFTNPSDVIGGFTHKPYVVLEAGRPNVAARIDGRYWMLSISIDNHHKVPQAFWTEQLAGPWTAEPGVLIPAGADGDFDAKHVDAISALYFADRAEVLCFYMGYPKRMQPGRSHGQLGSAQAAAWWRPGQRQARKVGPVLPPAQVAGHWASGWVGGLQVLPGREHRWIAVANASPTGPVESDRSISCEEPPPSLGGFAWTDAEIPTEGWRWAPQPIEWIEDVPADALAAGEGHNLWRQHLLALGDGRLVLFYNSGAYGLEQIYAKVSLPD